MATTETSSAPSVDSDELKNHLKLSSAIVQAMNEQRKTNNFTDCIVVVEGKEFSSYRFILSACSGFFRALFVSGMIEDRDRRVNIVGIYPKTFALILDCIFKAEDILNTDNMIEVWHAANQLDIPFLLKHCEDFVANNISLKNCFDIYKNAKLLDCKRIVTLSWETILKQFNSLRNSEEILNLSFEEMKSLVESNYLNAASEDHVIDLIIRWVSYEVPKENNVQMYLELVEEDDFATEIVEQTLCNSNSLSRENSASDEVEITGSRLFDKTAECKEAVNSDVGIQDPKIDFEISVKNDSGIGIGDEVSSEDKKHDKAFSRSAHIADLLRASRYCQISGRAIGNLLSNKIILGNEEVMSIIKESICYRETPTLLDTLTPGNIYRTSSNLMNVVSWLSNSVFMFLDVENLKITQIGSSTRINPEDSTVYNNCMYIVDCQQCYHFDSCLKKITSQTAFVYRTGHAVTSVGEHIYLVGGNNLAVERMSVHGNNAWVSVGSVPIATTSSTVAVVGANIIILGCEVDGRNDTTVVQCFNTETMTSYRMNDIASPPQKVITFKKNDQTFLLFRTGALWQLEVSEIGQISTRYVTMLWDFDRNLNGAVLYKDQLYLFDDTFNDKENSVWSISVPGVFESVRNLCYGGFGFHSIVIPK